MTATAIINSTENAAIPEFCVLGVRVHAVTIAETILEIERWIRDRRSTRFVTVTGMHGVAEAQNDPQLRDILNSAGLTVPDGMPLVWLANYHGFCLRKRVYGPELMLEFCRATESKGYRHFFYGGAVGVAELLAAELKYKFPSLCIAGTYTPPFRALNSHEEEELKRNINEVQPDIIWVGLSTPKQERWMYVHRQCYDVPVMLGVGAAFDLNSGRLQQAPLWMRENGFEWLFRLLLEPKRLWRRYIVLGSRFVMLVLAEMLGLRNERAARG